MKESELQNVTRVCCGHLAWRKLYLERKAKAAGSWQTGLPARFRSRTQYLLCAVVILRRVDIEKEVLGTVQI